MGKIEHIPGGKELAKVLHYYGLLEGSEQFKIICPFHKDLNPSMMINLELGTFFCFGCSVSGDAFKFVTLMEPDLDDLRACIKYYKIIRSKNRDNMPQIKKSSKRDKSNALAEASDYYYCLKSNDWSEPSQEKDYMISRGFSENALELAKAKINYNLSYPIIFPMLDNGTFKGWVCRTTNKYIQKKRKYLYNEGFSRKETIVGDYNSKVVVLVEGFMDKLKFNQFGLKHVGAILGWKISEKQIEKLRKAGVKIVISALDNDKCGKKGTLELMKHFKVVRFRFPKQVKDPGEITQQQFEKSYLKTKVNVRKVRINGNFR